MTTYGAISPRTAAYIVKDLLDRGTPLFVFDKFGMTKPLPKKTGKTMKFRRYFLASSAFTNNLFNPYEYYEQDGAGDIFNVATHQLQEGVTPSSVDLESEDIEVSIEQYGLWTPTTDVIEDLHEDPVLREAVDNIGEAAAFLAEQIRFNALVGGLNVFYSGGTTRATTDEVMTLNLQRRVVRSLKRNLGKPITSVTKSTADYGTEAIAASYIAVCHTDLESDIRNMDGFVPVEKYGTGSAFEGEIGKVESVRYITSTVVRDLGAEGSTTTAGMLNDGTNCYVYPILIFAANAYAVIPLKGGNSMVPMVLNPGVPREGDPLGQRGSVGVKFYHACKIMQDAWLARVEVTCSSLT